VGLSKKDNWFQRYSAAKLKAYQDLTWPQAFIQIGMASLFLVFVLAVFGLFGSSVPISAECEFSDWQLIPENVTMLKDDLVMYPDYSRCSFSVEASAFDVGSLLAGWYWGS